MYNKRSSGDKDSMLNMASTRVCTFGTVRYALGATGNSRRPVIGGEEDWKVKKLWVLE